MRCSFGGTPSLSGQKPLDICARRRGFVKACDDNDRSERMGLYLRPNLPEGETESWFKTTLAELDAGAGRGYLTTMQAVFN